ncbi:MAG: hypothetical protein WCH34_09740 [Bacteroidota bacterium]
MKFNQQNCFIGITVAVIFVTIFIVWFGYINHTSDRLYFSITQFDLPDRNDFTIGENSDVCYINVPEKYMTVSYEKDTFLYKINNTDSCLYYKINNINPNLHEIGKDSIITIFNIPLTGDSIFRRLGNFNNEYYMLKDVLTDRLTPEMRNSIDNGQIEFNSFIQKKADKYMLVILDKFTRINEVGYCYSKTYPQSAEFKIQFFKMNSWSVKKQEKRICDYLQFCDNKTYLSDSIRTYFAKPVQIFTEWGAGHILIKRNDLHFSVTFPKAITTTIPMDRIKATADSSETGVYLKQMLKSYPMPTDFYIPAFSNALSEYVCELSEVKSNNLIFQKANSRDTIYLATSGSFIPKIKINNQQLVTGSITYKTRILNKAFYWSKHWLLALAWFVLMVILFLSFPKSANGNTAEKVKNARYYILGLFTLFWFFLNQKLMIAEKLTFTYPFFENIYPVSYLTTLFSLFALFLLIILINRVYFNISNSNELGMKNDDFIKWAIPTKLKFLKKLNDKKVVNFDHWFSKILIPIGIFLFCLYATYNIIEDFIKPIWNSYLSSEISIFDPTSNAFNDNHFSVFWSVGFWVSMFFVLFAISPKWVSKIHKKLLLRLSKIKNPIKLDFNKKRNWIYLIMFIMLCPIALRGNFSTAFSVLILIYVLSFVMKKNTELMPNINDRFEFFIFKKWNFKKNGNTRNNNKFSWSINWFKHNFIRHKLWLWIIKTLSLCCFFVVIGISDLGFFINVFGIGITWIFLIFSCAKYNSVSGKLNNQILNTNFILGLLFGISFVVLFGWGYVNHLSNPENIDYKRGTRRIQNCIGPNQVKNAGYSYSESDMQWMEVMRHYAEKVDAGMGDNYDIYSEDNNFHPLVSSGQSPVVMNDVCVPGVYLGSLRWIGWFALLFGLIVLGILVYWFSIGDTWRRNPQNFEINRRLIGRLLAGNMWIGVTLYLVASYYWKVPFTGRLIPGFGVDAVGEALEIIVLFSFMCALFNPYKSKNI